ncbi:beta-N-acetylhexosaminidase [Prosthecomicrobium sp. N25]|uniref:beta-N-acetylhexosaminidase n=1 Tax=Prosthecomicrobium sp. N25 TaxID=3129254 RepID=UPI003077A544
MSNAAFISGCAGPVLSAEERAFFAGERPWGFILFKRNIETPAQVSDLVSSLRDAVGRPDAPVLIDQEGGRVQRMGPPHWPAYPTGRAYGDLFARDPETGRRAAWLGARLIAADLAAVGIDVDCLPVLDVPVEGAHDVIGARAYGLEPGVVATLGRAAAEGLLAGGVLPVVKHIPGHGRAGVDSHHQLPVVETSRDVLEATDFPPFAALAEMPLGMTAHVVYTALDARNPATTSGYVVEEIIRGRLGFAGALMSDDVSMKALAGTPGENARASLDAGCDLVLHCNGDLAEMKAVAAACRPLAGAAAVRTGRALAFRKSPAPFDVAAARAEFDRLMGASVA